MENQKTTNSNLFGFDYQTTCLNNGDGSNSRFTYTTGEGGTIVHAGKNSYIHVCTKDVSNLAHAISDKLQGNISTYCHKGGEVIGFSVDMGTKPTVVGDVNYKIVVNVPNNGTGAGSLMIQECRLICSNGAMRATALESKVKIPHNLTYPQALIIAEKVAASAYDLLAIGIEQDKVLNSKAITTTECMVILNRWFHAHEVADKKITLEQFRAMTAGIGEMPTATANRYEQLIEAFTKERKYNSELGLQLSKYTVFATVTNYLSRRQESSQADAPKEVMMQRAMPKLDTILSELNVLSNI